MPIPILNSTQELSLAFAQQISEQPEMKLGSNVKDLAHSITETEEEPEKLIQKILQITSSIGPRDDKREEVWQRDAEEILESGYSTGCQDWALVYTAISNAKGTPTLAFQVVDVISAQSHPEPKGHVFCISEINGDFYIINPSDGHGKYVKIENLTKDINEYIGRQDRFYIIDRIGRDVKDFGYTNMDDFKKSLQSRAKSFVLAKSRRTN